MNERSTEWKKIKLGLLGEFSKGSGITKNDLVQDGLPCVRYAELYTKFDFIIPFCISFISEETAKTAKPIQKGDILFAGSGETKEEIGKCAVYMNNLNAYAGGDNIIFRTTQAEPLYLSFYLNTLGRKQLNKLGQGDSIVHIHSDDLKNVIIPFPPLPEQEKIAEILGTWDTAIEKLSALIEQKKQLKKGLMQRLLTGKQRLPGFSAPWKKIAIRDFCDIKRGGSPRPIENYLTISDDGLNWLKIGDISPDAKYIYKTESKIKKEGLSKTTLIHSGDFILSNSMSFGRPYIMRIEACIHDGWLALTNIKKDVSKEYLFYLLISSETQKKFEMCAAGSGVRNLNKDIVGEIRIKLPSLPEQKAIADILSKADEEIALLTQKLSALKTQKTGLMQKLLTGQIRVKAA